MSGVQENYLQVTDLDYFILDETRAGYQQEMAENGLEITQLQNGKGLDPVQMLFADLPEPPKIKNSRNPYGITYRNWK